MHSRRRQVRETSRTHDSKKERKKTRLILTYFFFGAAALANLADKLLATELPPLREATVPRDARNRVRFAWAKELAI